MGEPGCPFCETRVTVLEDETTRVLRDAYPVSPGHLLVVPRRHFADYFEADAAERAALWAMVDRAKRRLEAEHSPAGFNIGINVGAAAGQTVGHLHIHLIPRYAGDMPDPEGGVRGVIPERRKYSGQTEGPVG